MIKGKRRSDGAASPCRPIVTLVGGANYRRAVSYIYINSLYFHIVNTASISKHHSIYLSRRIAQVLNLGYTRP
jgi:hypothetical protein